MTQDDLKKALHLAAGWAEDEFDILPPDTALAALERIEALEAQVAALRAQPPADAVQQAREALDDARKSSRPSPAPTGRVDTRRGHERQA